MICCALPPNLHSSSPMHKSNNPICIVNEHSLHVHPSGINSRNYNHNKTTSKKIRTMAGHASRKWLASTLLTNMLARGSLDVRRRFSVVRMQASQSSLLSQYASKAFKLYWRQTNTPSDFDRLHPSNADAILGRLHQLRTPLAYRCTHSTSLCTCCSRMA